MNDIRTQLPECPLAYEVPYIPGNIALIIHTYAKDLDWQEKMLPWTLASLINNTDIIMNGVHPYIACDYGTEARIKAALKRFDLPEHTALPETDDCPVLFDINCWAFRDVSNTHKLELTDTLKNSFSVTAVPYPDISEVSPDPQLYDMTHCTIEQFRHAIKHLMGAQLAMKI